MKNVLLKISILLNLGLLGGLICLLATGHKPVPAAPTRAAIATLRQAAPLPGLALADPKPFCWSQLHAPDYHVYVKNLRNIGCPEPTIRAIVTADVHAVFRIRSRTLVKQLSDLAGSSWSNQLAAASREPALRAELQQLPDAEAAKIAELLGLSSGAHPPLLSRQQNPPAQPVALPLVWQNVDLTALNLKSNQVQVINDLRQEFVNNIGGVNQNPDDPAYLERWQKAQAEVNEMLKGMLGISVYQDYQIAVMENNE